MTIRKTVVLKRRQNEPRGLYFVIGRVKEHGMIAKIHSAIPYGFEGKVIEVEGDANKGLPAFNIVGMANKTISEAKERVRSAIVNSELSFPNKKLTISLAPAELQKDGSYLDLPIALSVLVLSGQLRAEDVKGRMFVGELSLDGRVRPVHGIINVIEAAKEVGYDEVYVPEMNLAQAMLIKGIKIYGVATLKGLFLALKRQQELPTSAETYSSAEKTENAREGAKFANGGMFKGRHGGDARASVHVVKNTETEAKAGVGARAGAEEESGARVKLTTGARMGTKAATEVKTVAEAEPILDHIRGQELAKRAMTVAIAGHHNILIAGPPGAGKTLLAKAAANLLPDPTPSEKVEITKIYSLAGMARDEVVERRPFRSPHHSASAASMLGGGTLAEPGEISLAHKGVLFLDEIPEFPRSVLEALRQPLEDKVITVSRANRKTTYPADFMLVATMNPCPCGYLGDPTHECSCSEVQIQNYQRKLSGPLFDRIDMYITVERVENGDLLRPIPIAGGSREHDVVKNNITEAVARQKARFGAEGVFNSSLSSFQVTNLLTLEPEAKKLLAEATKALDLSARAYFKTIKVAQTIADLDGSDTIKAGHLSEALMYRKRTIMR